MKAVTGELPTGEGWAAEVKFDGMRIVAAVGDRTEVLLTPESSPARNWGFDVTPARYVTAIVTERGAVPASSDGIASLREPG